MTRSRLSARGARRRRVLGFGLAALVVAVLSGCGVPIDSAAHVVTTTPVVAPPPGQTSSAGTATSLKLYFLDGTKLLQVSRRETVYQTLPATADELLLALGNGPLKKEGSGLTTLLNSTPPGITSSYDPSSHLITVALDSQFVNTLFGRPLYEAYGQIVLTLMNNTLSPGVHVHGVLFTYEGPFFAYLATGTTTTDPVTAAAYEQLVE